MVAGKYLQSRNGKYQLDFRNSGLHLSCGSTAVWTYGFSNNEALYLDAEGLSLILLNSVEYPLFYKSVTTWRANTGGRAKKLVLLDDGNLVLTNGCNKTLWETKTVDACPAGLE